MLQRIGIAQALINDPDLLFFDEPTSGLDPVAHIDIRNLILRLKEQGKSVFLSSHQLSDVEMVCDRVAIIHRGHLRTTGHVADLIGGGTSRIVVDLSGTGFVDSSGLGALIAGLKSARQAGGGLRLAAPTEQVLTILSLTNLDKVLRPRDSVAAAF